MLAEVGWLAVLLVIGSAGMGCSPGAADDDGGDADADADVDGDGDADRGRDAGPFPDAGFADAAVCTDAVDVVLVLDVSSSMSFVLDSLEAEFARVVDAATALAPEPHFGLVAFVDDWALDRTGAAEGGVVHLEADTLRAAFHELRVRYTEPNRNPGDGPDGPTLQNPICEENALDALQAAATEFPWRDPSTRVVILVTDDTFLERPDNYGDRDGDGATDRQDFPREGDYPAEATIGEVVTALRDRLVRVFSFTRLAPPSIFDFTRCGTGRRLPWEDISDGWSTPYGVEAPIPDQSAGENLALDQVLSGGVSLADAITDLVAESYCDPVDLF